MRKMKERTIKDLTSLVKTKEGKQSNTSAITSPILSLSVLHSIFTLNSPLILYKAIEKNILSVSAERQKELETLQDIITSLTLQLRERDQQIKELKQSLKGNWY